MNLRVDHKMFCDLRECAVFTILIDVVHVCVCVRASYLFVESSRVELS